VINLRDQVSQLAQTRDKYTLQAALKTLLEEYDKEQASATVRVLQEDRRLDKNKPVETFRADNGDVVIHSAEHVVIIPKVVFQAAAHITDT
jgi:vacuolar-type H+-ATPase subunit E/Vma4